MRSLFINNFCIYICKIPDVFMTKQLSILIIGLFTFVHMHAQQKPLPIIAVKNIGNKIIVSWVNDYIKPITTLNIQRSFDSLKNYKTVGSVLSPQSRENGFADANAPYNKMYYRVFIAFEGGSYVYSNTARPIKDTAAKNNININDDKYPWMVVANNDSSLILQPNKPNKTYPSSNIFTAKDNNIIIHLKDASTTKYSVKFYDETEKFLFELKKIKEDYLIIEKVNFVHAGWFRFEIYEDGELIEENKFQILKEVKKL
jgi:hypothetical protein